MKPETADTAADAARDFEQVQADGPDGRRRQGRPREDDAAEVREQHRAMLCSCSRKALARKR